ncbi:branched-chain amino acid aminotransferase [Pseudohyphozyma bogoriensis]|nr:branched-chain amino acid aminotransferase [Pseudohyphozyma bogoriensis]
MPAVVPPSATFDWSKLAFDLYPTNGYVKVSPSSPCISSPGRPRPAAIYVWRDGAWGKAEWVKGNEMNLHVGSVALNYGASVFEGLKAFRHPDGQVKLFRPHDNAERISHSAAFVSMPALPEETFLEGVHMAVARNLEFVPAHAPYGVNGSMYVRPLLFASGANLILSAPTEFTFIVFVTPTGSLYGTAGTKAPAVDAFVLEDFDRAAPKGVGTGKLAGNYAPTFSHMKNAKAAGFPITLHLDSKTRTKIDEFSTSNFLAIAKRANASEQRTLVVPESPSILKSVTTKAIMGIAEGFGWKVVRREIFFTEVINGGFEEAITPIRSITYHDSADTTSKISIGDGVNAGEGFLEILSELVGIQSGVREDKLGWTWPKEGVDGTA